MIKIMLNKKIYVGIILTLLFFSCQSTSSAIKGKWALVYNPTSIKAIDNDKTSEELLELKEIMAQQISDLYVFHFLDNELKLTIKSTIDNIKHVNTIANWSFSGDVLFIEPSLDADLFRESSPWNYETKSKWHVSFKEEDIMVLTGDSDSSYVLTFKRIEGEN